jgi:2-oxoglutarate dehydrogenase E2 component (dihydrolipoamide succinyltransferase)
MDEPVAGNGPAHEGSAHEGPAQNGPAHHGPAHPGLLEIRAPAEQTEGTRSQVLRWLKAVGERVVLNEPLIELETDKVTVEIPAPGSGVVLEMLKREQDDVEPGELLGRIEVTAPDAVPTGAVAPGAAAVAGQASRVTRAPAPAGVPAAGPAGRAIACAMPPAASPAAASPKAPAAHLLSPAVRRLLAEHALEASSIVGSGEGGRVTVQDVLKAAAGADADVDAGAVAGAEPVRRVPHTAVRKRIAEHMARSLLHTAPHVTTVFEADMSAVLRHRAKCRDSYASDGIPLTLTAYFLQACVPAIRAVPEVNCRWTPAALEIFDSMHIGIATALENELVVPVLRSVESLDLRETARGLNDLTQRARERRLTPADVRGGTFTISNHGVSGSLLATPIVINQPQSAILGIGKLERRVVVEGTHEGKERFVVQPRCYITLTIDHRVLDGQRANLFLQTFVAHLAAWPDS